MFSRKLLVAAVCGLMLGPALTADAGEIKLTGTVRDVKRGDRSGGHADFETAGAAGKFGHVLGMVTMDLGQDRKPVYNPVRPSSKDTMQSASSLAQWYTDAPGVNASAPLTLTLANGIAGAGGVYSFSSNSFFPIDNQMFGNQGLAHNFHFTLEIHTKFTYTPGQKFTYVGDDDVWVYINGKRVIDLGGVHGAITGSVLLFDGKAFVMKAHFPTGGMVQEVSSSYAAKLVEKWTALGMSGTCPIKSGDKFVDLGLESVDQATVTAQFSGTSVRVNSTQDLSNIVLEFVDGVQQKFENLGDVNSGTFSGTGGNAGKEIRGVWVKSGDNASDDGPGYGQYFSVGGAGGPTCTLDFFFAERHTTQSNFRIDTTMYLENNSTVASSPMYD